MTLINALKNNPSHSNAPFNHWTISNPLSEKAIDEIYSIDFSEGKVIFDNRINTIIIIIVVIHIVNNNSSNNENQFRIIEMGHVHLNNKVEFIKAQKIWDFQN